MCTINKMSIRKKSGNLFNDSRIIALKNLTLGLNTPSKLTNRKTN